MSDIQTIDKQAEQILAQLEKDISKKKNSMMISVVGGVVLLVVVLFYFSFIKGLIRDVIEPKGLSLVVSTKVQDMLPELTKSVEKELTTMAPDVMKNAKTSLMRAIPEGRIYLEAQFVQRTEKAMDDLVAEFDKLVTDALSENKAVIVGFMKDMQDEHKKEVLVDSLYKSLKQEFDRPYIKADIESYTKVVQRLDKKVAYLFESEELSDEERIIRDIIYALKELAQRGKTKKV